MDWVTHRLEGPDDMPAHIKAAILPVTLPIPVRAGHMLLGRWQGIYVVEHCPTRISGRLRLPLPDPDLHLVAFGACATKPVALSVQLVDNLFTNSR